MLSFIGLGIEQSPSLVAISHLSACDKVFLEQYTTPRLTNSSMSDSLSAVLNGKSIELVKRDFVEDGRQILTFSKKGKVALVCFGDPMIATTHQELRTRALRQGINTKIIHGSSIVSAIPGELGLHSYNFGRVVTMTGEPMQLTAYNTIFQNLVRGLHTMVLLEWDESRQFFLSPGDAVKNLLDTENDVRCGIVSDETLVLISSRIGSEDSRVSCLTAREAVDYGFGSPPHVVVVPGRLHFTEREALAALTGRAEESIRDNSADVRRPAETMVTKYSRKTLDALGRARKARDNIADKTPQIEFGTIFDNVECYTQDALRFLRDGREELAVLSIGYAEGLLDSLRFGGILEFEW